MTEAPHATHHPLPSDARARHDLLPEGIDARDFDDAAPDHCVTPGVMPPEGEYRDPDGRPYPA